MAAEATPNHTQQEDLPQILVLGPPLILRHFESLYSHKYGFIEAHASPLPLAQFLATVGVDPESVRAILCNPLQQVTAEAIRTLPSLGIIATTSAGTDHVDLNECRRRNIQVTTIGGLYSDDVADFAVGLLIDVFRKISASDRRLRKLDLRESWNFPLGFKLGGKGVGIIGLGRIGMEVAKRLSAFGCRIMYHSRTKKPSVSYPFFSNLVELAASSDALVLCCALTAETHHIINRDVMLALGKEGVIINVGRGAHIDEKELVKCLIEGDIGGAGLDVFEDEPSVPKELLDLDNVVLSPHAASLSSEAFIETCELVCENLDVFFSNKPLITPLMFG